jgi:FlaA1/EpsC-like NDP-sugar epimerase
MGLYKIMDLMQEMYPNCSYKLIGSRPGEKYAERLKTDEEVIIYDEQNYSVIM